MIKSNLISTTKLSDGKTTIDLTKLTENYNKENMKKCSNIICCDKISNGQEVFDLSQLGTSEKLTISCGYDCGGHYEKEYNAIICPSSRQSIRYGLYDMLTSQQLDSNKCYLCINILFASKTIYIDSYYGNLSDHYAEDDLDGVMANTFSSDILSGYTSGWVELDNPEKGATLTLQTIGLQNHLKHHMIYESFTPITGSYTMVNKSLATLSRPCINSWEYTERPILTTMKVFYGDPVFDYHYAFNFKEYESYELTEGHIEYNENTIGNIAWFQWNTDTLKFNLHFMCTKQDGVIMSKSEVCDFLLSRTEDILNNPNYPFRNRTLIAYCPMVSDQTYTIRYNDVRFFTEKDVRVGNVLDTNFSMTLGDPSEYDFLLEVPYLII